MRTKLVSVIFISVVIVLVECGGSIAAPGDLDLAGFYKAGWTTKEMLKWSGIALAAIGAGAAVYLSAGTLTPAVTSIGTWIGGMAGLSGAAATSYGLALMGGGSLAAGGLGVKGGAALLTVALSLSGSVASETATLALEAGEKWAAASGDLSRASASKLTTLPLPIVEFGPEEYRVAVRLIKGGYDEKKGLPDVSSG